MRAMKRLMLLSMMVLTPVIASAQTETGSNVVWDVTKAVLIDPTTYVPATLSYKSMKMVGRSQTLFRNGWVEQNERFTIGEWVASQLEESNKRIRQMAPAPAGVAHQQHSSKHLRACAGRQVSAAPHTLQGDGRSVSRSRHTCPIWRRQITSGKTRNASLRFSSVLEELGRTKQEGRRLGVESGSPILLVSCYRRHCHPRTRANTRRASATQTSAQIRNTPRTETE